MGQEHVEHMFGLTIAEIKFMAQASGLKPRQFAARDEITPEFERTLAQIHPVFGRTMPGRTRFRLRVKQNGMCVFLGPRGCRLPTPNRPVYCRMYPFWFTPSARLTVLLSDTCLAQEGAQGIDQVCARMGADPELLKNLFNQLRKLAREHEQWVRGGGVI